MEHLSKQSIHILHQKQLNNGISNTNTNALDYISIFGGIDQILNEYLTNDTLLLDQVQLEQIHSLLTKLNKDESIMNKVCYTFDKSNTYLNYIFGEVNGNRIINILYHKLIISMLILSILCWILMVTLYRETLVYYIYVIPIICCIWIPYQIFWMLSVNIDGFKLIIKTFEFWFKLFYIAILLAVIPIDLFLFPVAVETANDIDQYTYILYVIFAIICMINLASLDAFYLKRYWLKIFISSVIALCFTISSLLYQFGTLCGTNNSSFLLKSIQVNATRILAIFVWKQAILSLIRKNKSVLIQHTPSIIWRNVNVAIKSNKENMETKHISFEEKTINLEPINSDNDDKDNKTNNKMNTYIKLAMSSSPTSTQIATNYHNISDMVTSEMIDSVHRSDDPSSSTTMINEKIEQSKTEQISETKHDDDIKDEITEIKVEEESKEVIETREQLEAKCINLTTMNAQFVYNTGTDLEIGLEYTFKNIGVETFWDKFWSNDAIFSPYDWIKQDPLCSNVEGTEWKLYKKNKEHKWYTLNIKCNRKLEDFPSFMGGASHSNNIFTFKYCKIKPNFYMIHKILSVSGVPLSDCFNVHQQIELRQKAYINNNITGKEDKISLLTHIKIYIGIEWIKSTWLKSQIQSKTIKSMNNDCIKYCQYIDKKILEEYDHESMKREIKKKAKSKKTNESLQEEELYNIIVEMEELLDEYGSSHTNNTAL